MPVQIWLGQQTDLAASTTEVFWWRTYSPPVWLLDHSPLNTTDLMGMPAAEMQAKIMDALDVSSTGGEGGGGEDVMGPGESGSWHPCRVWRSRSGSIRAG